jgi:RNA polymerase sigma-70 factor (ECF subfamily)
LGILYDRYGRLVFTVAVHIVGDAQTAEEITQDVFVRVWEGAASYRSDLAKVNSWLISITRHRSIDELRRRGSRPEKDALDWPDDSGMENGDLDGIPVMGDPAQQVEVLIQQRRVRQAVAGLAPDQRRALNLAFFKGLSHQEIAEILGEPLGTVKSRIRLAMNKLRNVLAEAGRLQ